MLLKVPIDKTLGGSLSDVLWQSTDHKIKAVFYRTTNESLNKQFSVSYNLYKYENVHIKSVF